MSRVACETAITTGLGGYGRDPTNAYVDIQKISKRDNR